MLSQIYTDLSVAQNVPQFPTGCVSNIFSSVTQPHSSIYLYLDGSLRPTPPLNFQSQITGNLAVYGFAFSPFSPTPSPPGPGCILSLTVLRARTRASFFWVFFQGRRDCNFSTTAGVNSCLDGG